MISVFTNSLSHSFEREYPQITSLWQDIKVFQERGKLKESHESAEISHYIIMSQFYPDSKASSKKLLCNEQSILVHMVTLHVGVLHITGS